MLHICFLFTKEIHLNITTFIFDLGGVIINLDENATINAFSEATQIAPEHILKASQSDLFLSYEKGLIDDETFRAGINKKFDTQLSDEQIDLCWNAMLGDIPKERTDLMLALRKKHKVIVLSNTNAIHIRAFNKILKKASGKDALAYFADRVFFSHELHLRKPDIEIYERILALSETKPEEALFLDDKKENLIGAERAGINTLHVTTPKQLAELYPYV